MTPRPANRNMQIEIGALMTGVVAFGLAAFMPFLIWKLMPIVAAAVVAQGDRLGADAGVAAGDAVRLLRAGGDGPDDLGRTPARRRRRGGGGAAATGRPWWWPPRRRRRRRSHARPTG